MEHSWHRILQGISAFIQQRLNAAKNHKHTSWENPLVAWFRWKGKTALCFGQKTVLDQAGYKSKVNDCIYHGNPPTGTTPGEIRLGYELRKYTRREEAFTIRLEGLEWESYCYLWNQEKSQIVDHWRPVNIWLEDATGNQSKNASWNNQEKDGMASELNVISVGQIHWVSMNSFSSSKFYELNDSMTPCYQLIESRCPVSKESNK